jgi:hypothetical protein
MPGRIKGTAFFPGGSGLYLEQRDRNIVEFPFGGVMILGHNFDSETGFQKSLSNGSENLASGTWRSLLDLLKTASIPLEECFFTNAFMGLCQGDDNKRYLGRGDPQFRAACLEFLKAQIKMQRPRLILALGLHVPPLLASASYDLTDWTGQCKGRSFDPELHLKDIDRAPIFREARFDFGDGSFHTSAVTVIAHPSDRRNSEKRAPSGFLSGRAGEAELIRSGWEFRRPS